MLQVFHDGDDDVAYFYGLLSPSLQQNV